MTKKFVMQINVSEKGGLPKIAMPRVLVEKSGLSGDYNRYRTEKLKGDLTSAVLLLPNETIVEFAQKGYDIRPGSMGENFTLEGIRYDDLSMGRRLLLGKEELQDGAIIKVERVCEPCDKLLVYGKEFPKVTIGRRGMYCSVEKEGYVSKGDPVEFL